jgi:hypothetical protein
VPVGFADFAELPAGLNWHDYFAVTH